MIQYEIGNFDTIQYETRSIRREISKSEKAYRTEHLMLSFLNKPIQNMLSKHREKIWKKMEPEFEELRNNIFEMQMLKMFDFAAWIESKIRHIPLDKILIEKANTIDT